MSQSSVSHNFSSITFRLICITAAAAGAYFAVRGVFCSFTFNCKCQKCCKHTHRVLPRRLIFVRHGQSEGNVDPILYKTVPDNSMHLTKLGVEQGRAAGISIKNIIGNESVRFIVSPCRRTLETFAAILEAWGPEGKNIRWSEEPRIREQDFGNFQDPTAILECKSQRDKFGSFFYRFPSGESPADVYDRISSFLESFYRMFSKQNVNNYVLVTHGVSIRVLLTRFFKYRIAEFEQLANFHNGEFVVLEYSGHKGYYELKSVIHNEVALQENGDVDITTTKSNALRVYSNAWWACPSVAIGALELPPHISPFATTVGRAPIEHTDKHPHVVR